MQFLLEVLIKSGALEKAEARWRRAAETEWKMPCGGAWTKPRMGIVSHAMARVEERIHIHRPVAQVWDVLVRWEEQPEWMQDARAVTVTSEQREGVGVTIRVPTDIALGIVVTDEMRVTEWVEHERIAVVHTGRVIRGHGAFELAPTRRPDGTEGTLFTWWEEVDAPLGRLGEVLAQRVAMPIVGRVFRRSLAALKAHVEQQPTPTA